MCEDVILVDSFDFEDRINDGIVMLFFYEHENVQSRGLEDIIDEIASGYSDCIRVLALDVEQSPDVAIHYAVDTVPSVVFFKDGMISEKVEGANPPHVYTDIIDALAFM